MQDADGVPMIANKTWCPTSSVMRIAMPVMLAEHMVNLARKAARKEAGAFFADQFENESNFRAHLKTGEEIITQAKGVVDAFVCGAGTGGTIAGVSHRLKRAYRQARVFLVDPPGSSLFLKVCATVHCRRFHMQDAHR